MREVEKLVPTPKYRAIPQPLTKMTDEGKENDLGTSFEHALFKLDRRRKQHGR